MPSIKSVRALAAALALLSASSIFLTGCNTVAGAGQDVSAAGRAVTNSSDRVRTGQ